MGMFEKLEEGISLNMKSCVFQEKAQEAVTNGYIHLAELFYEKIYDLKTKESLIYQEIIQDLYKKTKSVRNLEHSEAVVHSLRSVGYALEENKHELTACEYHLSNLKHNFKLAPYHEQNLFFYTEGLIKLKERVKSLHLCKNKNLGKKVNNLYKSLYKRWRNDYHLLSSIDKNSAPNLYVAHKIYLDRLVKIMDSLMDDITKGKLPNKI